LVINVFDFFLSVTESLFILQPSGIIAKFS